MLDSRTANSGDLSWEPFEKLDSFIPDVAFAGLDQILLVLYRTYMVVSARLWEVVPVDIHRAGVISFSEKCTVYSASAYARVEMIHV